MKPHQARKRFGQNFLQDTRIIQDIVNAVRPQPEDTVIEIGPGLAAITEPLCRRLSRLHVCEIDRDIIAYLRAQPFAAKLQIHEGDVLQFDFSGVPGRKKSSATCPTIFPRRCCSSSAPMPAKSKTCTLCCKKKWSSAWWRSLKATITAA